MNCTNIALHTRQDIDQFPPLQEVIRILQEYKVHIFVTQEAQKNFKEAFEPVDYSKKYDFFLIYGGDGSVLELVQRMKNFQTPILPLSAGRLGFLSEILPKDFKKTLRCIKEEEHTLDHRALLSINILRSSGEREKYIALNEVVLSQSRMARMVSIRTSIDDECLTVYRADGVLVSTATGSTAYNLSIGGPLLYPRFPGMILAPISPHSFSHRPLILPAEKEIILEEAESNREQLVTTIDGQKNIEMKKGDRLRIRMATENISFLRMPEEHYFKTLKRKLHWGI